MRGSARLIFKVEANIQHNIRLKDLLNRLAFRCLRHWLSEEHYPDGTASEDRDNAVLCLGCFHEENQTLQNIYNTILRETQGNPERIAAVLGGTEL